MAMSSHEQLKDLIERARPERLRQFYQQVGEKLRQRIRVWVLVENRWQPLAPSTDAAKRQAGLPAAPLTTKTNSLLRSLYDPTSPYHIFEVTEHGVTIGTSHPNAPYHHFGTKAHEIRAKQARALRFIRADGKTTFATRVFHPGVPARPLFPPDLPQQAQEIMRELQNYLLGENR